MWLYSRYVLRPAVKHEFFVLFEPDPEMDAQIEKDRTGPRMH